MQSTAYVVDETHGAATSSQVTRDLEFTLGKGFQASNYVDKPDLADRSAADVTGSIGSFLPSGLQRVTTVDIYYTYVTLSISQIHVIEDRDFGAGEVYLEVIFNDYEHDIFDNGGSYYVVNDGDYVTTSISVSSEQYSIDGWFIVEIIGWEDDADADQIDDYMGGEYFSVDLSGLTSVGYEGWYVLNDYPPVGGNNAEQIEVYLDLDFTMVDSLTYPDDFMSPSGDGSYLISAIYQPKIHYDVTDGGNNPGISVIFQQVFRGYDPAIGADAYLIYYMLYYEQERDNFGLNFGHYYDFEPLLLYVQSLGSVPYRIVFRNVGTHTLPPKLIIQDYYAPTVSGSTNVSVTTELCPLLGDHAMVDYEVKDNYWSTSSFQHKSETGLSPFMNVPILTVTNTYHQMELGVPLTVTVDSGLNWMALQPMSDSVIEWGYNLLDEAFASPVNVYEGVTLWNGGDYKVPENMSLTFDMLRNPFLFPYVVDCYEEVVHYTESAQDYKENGFYYDIDLLLEFRVPATVTFEIPTTVYVGQTYDVTIDLQLDPNDITVAFSYDVMLGYVLHWWFIGVEEDSTYSGDYKFKLALSDFADTLQSLGFGPESVVGAQFNNWFTVTGFSTSTDLLGTLLDATVEVHLLEVLSTIMGPTSVGWLVGLIEVFLDSVNLVVSPEVSGSVTTGIEAMNSAIVLDTDTLTFQEGNTRQTVQMTVVGGHTSTGISLSNVQYHVLFATDWGIDFDFTDTMNYFVSDFSVFLGTFPEITISSDDHSIGASLATGYTEALTMSVTSAPTTTTSGVTGPGDVLGSLLLPLGLGGVVIVALVVVMLRRRQG
ncbi:MAG: hypothetical protein ACE5H4_14525 [Candidatus Thorarchaeota archaeon]